MDLKRGEFVATLIFVLFFSSGKSQTTWPPCQTAQDFGNIAVCKDGKVVRRDNATLPASLDPETNVQSKDIVYSPQLKLSARLFVPAEVLTQPKKLPLIVYYHGGGFCIASFATPAYHNMTVQFAKGSNAIVVSFDYRLAPENLLPIAFDDAWTAMQWLGSHANGQGPESWLNQYADFNKVILMGDSAGATLAVNVALRHGEQPIEGINFKGMLLQMPFFFDFTNDTAHFAYTNKTKYIYPTALGTNNLLLNPKNDPKLCMLGVPNVTFFVGGNDVIIDLQKPFIETLSKSPWKGTTNIQLIDGARHMFNIMPDQTPEEVIKAKKMMVSMNEIVGKWVA